MIGSLNNSNLASNSRDLKNKAKNRSISQVGSVDELKAKYILNNYDSPKVVKKSSRYGTDSKPGKSDLNENVLYSVKGKHRYQGSIISKPKRDQILQDNVEMGVVGKPIIGSSSRLAVIRKESKRNGQKGNFRINPMFYPTFGKNLRFLIVCSDFNGFKTSKNWPRAR